MAPTDPEFPAIAGVRHRTVAVNGIEMHLAEAGEPDSEQPPVILCHGFPELWYSWRHQLPVLAAAGHHVIAPDQRGYGRTTRPDAIDDYDIVHLTDDLVALLDELGHEQGIFVGHDWGSMVVWHMALLHPDRVAGVCGMSVPYAARGEQSLIQVLEAVMGDRFFYILHFQEPGKADADLGKDPREAMRRFLCAIGGEGRPENLIGDLPNTATFWEWMPEAPNLPPWLSAEELDFFATEFERTGFTGGINWYRNFHRNWELTPQLLAAKIDRPSFFIAGERDPVLVMSSPAGMANWLTDLRGTVLIPGVGHWVQQEAPEATNEALLRFLGELA
jgi:pimeloyl-ACP methyl ester carboxylesterase